MLHFRENICANVSAPYELSISTMVISTVFWIFTIPGNLLVILAVVIDPNKKLRTPFNLFVVNLAVADLLVGAITEPVSTYIHYWESLGTLTLKYHKILHIPYFISATASVLSLAALTWDRYVAITSPLVYRTMLSATRAGAISGVIWFISIIVPPVVYTKVGYIRYSFIFINTVAALTLLILIFTYVRIFQRFRGQIQEWDILNENTEENQVQKNLIRWETKVTKTLVLMLAMFLACYAPACIFSYLMNFCWKCSCISIHYLRDWHFLFVMLSSGLNPILYAWRLEPYRSAFSKILHCACWHLHAQKRSENRHVP